MPLIAKDTLKETVGGELGITDRERSRALGSAVFELMGVLVSEFLSHDVSLIVEGNFRRGTRVFESLPPCRIVQVHVTASPDMLRGRMLERDMERHPVHYDREAADGIAREAEAGEWDALPLEGVLVRLDTTAGFALDAVALAQRVLAQH